MGSEVIQQLQRDLPAEMRPGLVITSGNCLDEDVAMYKRCGADDVLSKPLPNSGDLAKNLSLILRKRKLKALAPSGGAGPVPGEDDGPLRKRQRGRDRDRDRS